MKFKIIKANKNNLLSATPKKFHCFLDEGIKNNDKFIIILYPFDEKSVVLSSHVEKAIKKITINKELTYIALSNNFTEEAKKLMYDSKINFFYLTGFYWTDESYKEVTKAV